MNKEITEAAKKTEHEDDEDSIRRGMGLPRHAHPWGTQTWLGMHVQRGRTCLGMCIQEDAVA